jgi:hypothetical protein
MINVQTSVEKHSFIKTQKKPLAELRCPNSGPEQAAGTWTTNSLRWSSTTCLLSK